MLNKRKSFDAGHVSENEYLAAAVLAEADEQRPLQPSSTDAPSLKEGVAPRLALLCMATALTVSPQAFFMAVWPLHIQAAFGWVAAGLELTQPRARTRLPTSPA